MTTTITNAEVLRTVTVSPLISGFNQWRGRHWPAKFVGPEPSDEAFTVALAFGKQRKCGPEAGFIALMLRPEGASVAELCMAFKAEGAAHNHAKALSCGTKTSPGLNYFSRTKGNGRFYLTFTAKGVKALEKALTGFAAVDAAGAAEAPAKAKKAANKRRKGKPVPATVEVADLPPNTVLTPEQTAALPDSLPGDVAMTDSHGNVHII